MEIQHASVNGVVTVELVEGLIQALTQEADHLPMRWNRMRAFVNQLYSTGVLLNDISAALMRDIEAGDAILSEMSDEEQHSDPRSAVWVEWLETFHLAQKCLRAIEHATGAIDLPGQAVGRDRLQAAQDAIDALKDKIAASAKEAA